jgi:hypothetical protein
VADNQNSNWRCKRSKFAAEQVADDDKQSTAF